MDDAATSSSASPSEPTLVRRLVSTVDEISAIADYRNAYRKTLCSLARRIKLLAPMFDELADSREPISDDALQTLAPLEASLAAAKDLLRLAAESSKIFLVLERDKMVTRIHEVTTRLEEALTIISFDKLNVSDEVREQVELVHAQFRRAKERGDILDVELYNDLCSLYNQDDANEDSTVLGKVAEGLPLTTISDLKQESLALHEMVFASDGDPGENIEKMSRLLKKIKDFVLTQNPDVGTTAISDHKILIPGVKQITPLIPDDFRCPISLELMTDPVIVSSGQTYERSYIEKWLASGHDTCPKTQQRLSSAQITPNYVLRSLIAQWCEANGIESPKRPLQPNSPASACSSSDHPNIEVLLLKLLSSNLEDQRSATAQLRLLAKRSASNRICIAKAGAIPLLKKLLSAGDLRTQEHAVTALLNLSICEENKSIIMRAGAVPDIVHVLRNGSMEARENAAATLFSLSVVDEYKIAIGLSGAIQALVELLREGTQRGKKDAATALFNLCIFQGNKGKAVRAGIVPLIMGLLMDPAGSMVDEALAVLAILSSHPEGKAAIAATEAVPVLVDVIGSGSPRTKENAAAILLNLCCGEQQIHCLSKAQECGLMGLLQELAMSGTDRGKRKAVQLLERLNRFLEQQFELQAQAQASSQVTLTDVAPSQVNAEPVSEQSVKPATSETLDM